ncbi:CdaR family protein [Treponema sp.]|uniref:CdaR family protein n=1 Tax=Treponema sp. TaxID=166 RepID=UPI003F0293EC
MSINQLLAKITKNWPVKAICFVLAVMICFFHQLSLLDRKTFSVPLEVRANGNMVPVSGLEQVKYIRVKVRTRRDQIASIVEKDLRAFVDVSAQIKEGVYDFPVYIELDDKIVQLDLEPLEIYNQPDIVRLQIQKKVTKPVPLYSSVLGKAAHGYKALSAELEPSFITLCGPESMLEQIDKIPVGAVSIEGADSSVSKIVSPLNTNAYISFLGEKNSVRVSVPVVVEGSVREFTGVPVFLDNLSSQLAVSGEAVTIDFSVEGKLLDVEKLSQSDFRVSADCAFITEPGIYEVPVHIELPGSISVSSQSLTVYVLNIVHREPDENFPMDNGGSEPTGSMLKIPVLS